MTTEKDKEPLTQKDEECTASRCEEGDAYNNKTEPSWGKQKYEL